MAGGTFKVFDRNGRESGRGIEVELERIADALRRGYAEAPLEIARGINDGGARVKTIVTHALQEQMGLRKYSDVLKVVRSVPADPEHLRYEIASSKGGMNIQDFGAVATPLGVQVHVWGVDRTFKRSFVTKSGFMLARVAGPRLPIRRLYGPAPYKELLKGETVKAFDRAVPMLVEPLVMTRIVKLFG